MENVYDLPFISGVNFEAINVMATGMVNVYDLPFISGVIVEATCMANVYDLPFTEGVIVKATGYRHGECIRSLSISCVIVEDTDITNV